MRPASSRQHILKHRGGFQKANGGKAEMKKFLMGLSLTVLLVGLGTLIWYHNFFNRFQVDGIAELGIFDAPVMVRRDEYGIPYISAESYADLIRAQGFIAAQDRMLQIEMYRRMVSGNLAELIGEKGIPLDTRSRVAGYQQAAARNVPLLSENARDFISWYAQGLNAFIETRPNELPAELKLMGIRNIKPWTLTDMMALHYLIGSIHGTNLNDELLALAISQELGDEALALLQPLNQSPDRIGPALITGFEGLNAVEIPDADSLVELVNVDQLGHVAPPAFGSNNWATSPQKSASDHAILASDPHLDARQLPGPMYPVGLFAPGINAIGITLAGMPGLLIGRTDHSAFGVTNGYGDSQDSYIEVLDPQNPDNYLEGDLSLPFEVSTETIRVKVGDKFVDHPVTIRKTHRGPVISDHEVFGIKGGETVTLRFSWMKKQGSEIGMDRFLTASSVEEFDRAVQDIDLMYFNFVFADQKGSIGQRASGLIPVRDEGGAIIRRATAQDNWTGWIPKDEMPGSINPERHWVGTANHDTRPDDYPYYYSSHFAPDYRYRRIHEAMASADTLSAEQNWELANDTRNLLAVKLAPLMAQWLRGDESTVVLAELLEQWDFRDDSDSVGATVFHVVYEQLPDLVFNDDMSPALAKRFLNSRYFFQQRFDNALLAGESPWFDNGETAAVETAAKLVILAGRIALDQLQETLGPDSSAWQWGAANRMIFVSPLRTEGFGRDWLGGGEHPGRGSHETLNRAGYSTDKFPYTTAYIASARLVMDFADNEKIMASLPGGNVARQGHPWFASQLDNYLTGDWIPWWRNENLVIEHARHTLELR
jgi:penicillin amidase